MTVSCFLRFRYALCLQETEQNLASALAINSPKPHDSQLLFMRQVYQRYE